MQNIKNNKLAKTVSQSIKKKATNDGWAYFRGKYYPITNNKETFVEEVKNNYGKTISYIGDGSKIEQYNPDIINMIGKEKLQQAIDLGFRPESKDNTHRFVKGKEFFDIRFTDENINRVLNRVRRNSYKKQTLSKKAAYPFYEMVKDTSPLYTPNDPIGVQSDEHNTTIDEMKPNLEGIDYETEFALAGFSNKYPNVKIDLAQVEKGIKVEMEHTSNKQVALKIALDHLAEISNYYDLLEEMEDKAKEMGTFNKDIKGADNE